MRVFLIALSLCFFFFFVFKKERMSKTVSSSPTPSYLLYSVVSYQERESQAHNNHSSLFCVMLGLPNSCTLVPPPTAILFPNTPWYQI